MGNYPDPDEAVVAVEDLDGYYDDVESFIEDLLESESAVYRRLGEILREQRGKAALH